MVGSCVFLCFLAGPGLAVEPGGDEFQREGGWLFDRPGLLPYGKADQPWPEVPIEKEKPERVKSIPLSFKINYTVASDYVFRGINFSEYPGEGREKLNHQLGLNLELDTCQMGWNLGTFGFSYWADWYTDEKKVNPTSSSNLHESDYIIYWNYQIPQLLLNLQTGWAAITFPQMGTDTYYTNEWYISLGLNDGPLFGFKEPLLTPYVAYFLDTDDHDGSWLEWGLSHKFPLGNMGLADTPVLKDITIKPSFVMGIDGGQLGKSWRVAHMKYGLDLTYDLSGALKIPQEYGNISITGFVYFSDAIFDKVLNDELWGGVTFCYAW